MTYLTKPQVDVLLTPIQPSRVGRTPKGMSHVEAYEIRAHLNRIFGFARWSADVVDQRLIYESQNAEMKWSVAYRTILCLTVCAKDGTVLATYTEGATGDATNYGPRADAHDNALKTSESQALKRCAVNLGDQFGLGLYVKGSMAALVKSLVPDNWPETGAVDVAAHVTETPPEEEAESVEGGTETDKQTFADLEDLLNAATDLETLRVAGENVSHAVSMGLLSEADRIALQKLYKQVAGKLPKDEPEGALL